MMTHWYNSEGKVVKTVCDSRIEIYNSDGQIIRIQNGWDFQHELADLIADIKRKSELRKKWRY
jgi:hypothetical protein